MDHSNDDNPRVVAEEEKLSHWVTLVTRYVEYPGRADRQTYHSFRQFDYVSVLALTTNGLVPLVRQYRPVLDKWTLELPGGLIDSGNDPAEVARNELLEETGLTFEGDPILLGKLAPDTGRLENQFWCYFAPAAVESGDWRPEAGVQRVLMEKCALREAITNGQFNHALHIALFGLAMMQGRFSWG